MKKFSRSKNDDMIGGVCGGIGEYFNVNSNLFRFLFVMGSIFFTITTVAIYSLMWIFLKK